MPLHGPKLEAPDSGNKMVIMRTKLRGVSSRVVACYHDDQLVRSGASRCQPSHRVLGALELVAVADENQAIRRLVWGREGRKGRSKGNEEEQSHCPELSTAPELFFVQKTPEFCRRPCCRMQRVSCYLLRGALPCKSLPVHRLSRRFVERLFSARAGRAQGSPQISSSKSSMKSQALKFPWRATRFR